MSATLLQQRNTANSCFDILANKTPVPIIFLPLTSISKCFAN
jgi:hypothetical protein